MVKDNHMKLFVFGLGYTASHFIRLQGMRFALISGTIRSVEKTETLYGEGIQTFIFNPPVIDERIMQQVTDSDAVLISIQPNANGDVVLREFSSALMAAKRLRWIGYLSTVGVYGNHDGGRVKETNAIQPISFRSRQRAEIEKEWLAFGEMSGKPVHIFRLAGIYGPNRNAFEKLANGTARRLIKPGQVFNRIHVEDIAATLAASLDRPRAGAIYNIADDEPAPPQEVVAFAAKLMQVEIPPDIPFDSSTLNPMTVSFYSENKRVDNSLIKEELGVRLSYPTFREGLKSLYKSYN